MTLLETIQSLFVGKKYKGLNLAVIASDRDKNFANKLIKILENCSIVCWSSENLLAGQDWKFETKKACRNAKYVFVLISESANKEESEYQQFIKWALEMQGQMPHGGVKIIPVKVESCISPEHLTEFQPIEPNQKEWLKIIELWKQFQEQTLEA